MHFQAKMPIIPIIMLISLLIQNFSSVYATTLVITLATNKEEYGTGEKVTVWGNLTLEGYGFRVGLVAIEIDSPLATFIYRTMQTGPIENPQWEVEITNLYPCDQRGYPKYSFEPGTFAYVKVELINNSNTSKLVAIAIYLQYSNGVPFAAKIDKSTIPANSPASLQSSFPIPNTAPLGTTWVFASLFTDDPKYGGLPYCPEKNATFLISTTSGSIQASETKTNLVENEPPSSFRFTFNLPKGTSCPFGTYTIFAAAKWQNYTATTSKTFKVVIIGDVDGDKDVDMDDVGIAALAYGSKPGNPRWDPRADITKDGIIDMDDIGLICLHFGEKL
ncbi:MAG: hypothetical protein QXK93_07120 [Candidatus Bathyarchaeia archaeon]